MTWVVIPNSVFESGKPARAIDMRNLRDNIAALANGDSGAPKIKAPALNLMLPYTTQTGSLPAITWTGLDRVQWLEYDVFVNNAGATNAVRLRLSDDNGANWAGYSTLFSINGGVTALFRLYVDLVNGVLYHGRDNVGLVSSGITLPAGAANAIQMQMNSGGASVIQGIGKAISGVSP